MPRIYFASGVHWAASHEKALELLLDSQFPYKDTVILEGSGLPDTKSGATGKTQVLKYENNTVRCAVESGGGGYLVLLDSYYPGWRATLDGEPIPILRANYAFRAVRLPAGKHVVEFRYKPMSFYLGSFVTAITLFGGAVLLFKMHRSHEVVLKRIMPEDPKEDDDRIVEGIPPEPNPN